jgi:3',5'-cyclic AMP phosphodiesterase CpdA
MSAGIQMVQVSDLHLGLRGANERERDAAAAWEQFRAAMQARPPQLIVVTGDLVIDDPGDAGDRRHAHRLLTELGVPVRAVPGNHDVGDHAVRGGLPTDWHGRRIAARHVRDWERLWGPGNWVERLGEWTLLGLNSQLFGSGLAAEERQWEWLEQSAVPAATGTKTVVFMHELLDSPLPAEDGENWMMIPQEAGARLRGILDRLEVRLLASGHTHAFHRETRGGLEQLTAPSLVGPIPVREDMTQPIGDRTPGWLELELGDDGATVVRRAREGEAQSAEARALAGRDA